MLDLLLPLTDDAGETPSESAPVQAFAEQLKLCLCGHVAADVCLPIANWNP